MIRRPPRSTLERSSAASDVYKRQDYADKLVEDEKIRLYLMARLKKASVSKIVIERTLSLIHISEPTRPY